MGAREGRVIAPGGIDDTAVLVMIGGINAKLRAAGHHGTWMIVHGNEVVGLISALSAPNDAGQIEIGYGIAATRRRRGFATAAVGHVVRIALADPSVHFLFAQTAVDNPGSQRALLANGFSAGSRRMSDDGELIAWHRAV